MPNAAAPSAIAPSPYRFLVEATGRLGIQDELALLGALSAEKEGTADVEGVGVLGEADRLDSAVDEEDAAGEGFPHLPIPSPIASGDNIPAAEAMLRACS